MRILMILSLIVMFIAVPASQSQSDYPACWESELRLISVSVQFYEIYFSLLGKVETAADLVDFAEGYLEYRQRDWASSDRCAESIELAWLAEREISLRAAYMAIEFGLRAKIDADPAVLAQYNPLGAVLSDAFYPERFNQYIDGIQDLIDSGERRYVLSPDDGALPPCNSTELAGMAPILPDYHKVIAAAKEVGAVEELLEVAEMQLSWREVWSHVNISRYDDGRISTTPRDGLAALPACSEAAELLWLMHLTVSDASRSAALTFAGVYDYNNPYLEAFKENAEKVDDLIARIENSVAEPGAERRHWTTCADTQRAALKELLPDYERTVLDQPPLESWEDLLAYMKDGISWRQALWSSLPDCADAIKLALAFSQLSGDARAFFAYHLAEVPIETNPFLDAMELGEFVVEGFGGWLVGGSAVRLAPPRLRNCSVAEFKSLATIVAQYDMLREAMTNINNMREFVNVADAALVWRDSLSNVLPKCREAFEIGVLMSQIADDYIALLGLTYAGYGRDTNPYFEWFQTNSAELTDQLRTTSINRGPYEIAWDYGGQLEACNRDELATLGQILRNYLDLLEKGGEVGSLENLEAFGDAQIAWRTNMWPQLPNCAEAFEVGLHIYRTAGDKILFDLPAIATEQLAKVIGGNTTLRARLGEIFADLPLKWRPEHTGEFVSHRQHCSTVQATTIINVLQEFASLIDRAPDLVAEPGGVLSYLDRRIAWRQNLVSSMPRCVIVFKLDGIPEVELAEGLTSNIPFLGAVLRGSDLIHAIASALADEENTVQAVQPYTNRMPLCSDAELRSLQQDFPALSDLINDVPDIGSRSDLNDFIARKLVWRTEVWAQMPICAEALEVGFLIHQIASDMAAAIAFGYHDISEDQIPFVALETEGRAALGNARSKISELVDSGEREQTSPSFAKQLPRCSDAELETIHGYTVDHRLFPSFPDKSMANLLEYIDHLLSWRLETWAPLPACIEAYLIGSLVSRQTNDFVTYTALAWAPGARGRNPFFPEIRDDANNLVDLTILVRTLNREGIDRFIAEHYPPVRN